MSSNSNSNFENNDFNYVFLNSEEYWNLPSYIEENKYNLEEDDKNCLINMNLSDFIVGGSKTTGLTDFVNEDEKNYSNISNILNHEKIKKKIQFLNKKTNNSIIEMNISNDKKEENIRKKDFISNEKKKQGRKNKCSNEKGKKNKFDFYNMLHTIKVYVNQCIISILNGFLKLEKKGKTIKKILGQITKDCTINLNKTLFNSKIKDIISTKISCKCKNFNEDYNEQVINDLLLNTSNDKIKYFLNLTYEKFIFEVFLKFNESEFFKEFNFENNYLFKSINLEGKEEYEEMIQKGIIKQLEIRKPRKRKNENYRKTFILNMKEKGNNIFDN